MASHPTQSLNPRTLRDRCAAPLRRRRAAGLLLLAMGVLGHLHAEAFSQDSNQRFASPPRTITDSYAAHHLEIAEAKLRFPIRLQAVVTYFDYNGNQHSPTLFVSDRTGSVFVSLLDTAERLNLKPGDLLEVTGVSGMGHYAPIVDHASVRVIGHMSLPAAAPRVQLNDVLTGLFDGEWVEVEAIVYAVRQTDTTASLSLAMRGGIVSARAVREPGMDYSKLLDSKVLLRGNAAPSFNHQGQITGGKILFPGMAGIRVEQSSSTEPFALPIQRPDSLLLYTPKLELQHRVHLRGAVTLFWPGKLLCIEDSGQSICAQIEQTETLQPGGWAEVVGFPVVGEFTPNLLHATYRAVEGNSTLTPAPIDARQALDGLYDGRLVAIEGRVIGQDDGAADPTIVLASGSSIFYAVLPKPSDGSPVGRLEPGSQVRLTGICTVQSDSAADASESSFAIPKSFRILLHSPAGVMVLRRPSWWNAEHTLRVLALAFTLALFALFWGALLSRRVRQQSEVIRGQLLQTAALKDAAESATIAAEFHAAHDELTGTLNRRAVFAALEAEFETASLSGSAIGVIMLDLDHFKRVNDTHGHLAGDEVLRETVRRISVAVRSSDIIGRYGGEEFIAVLPACSKLQLQSCAERIRTSISHMPMFAGDTEIHMTASVGTTLIPSPTHPMLDALAAADSALYQAKNSGRNRVILKDLTTGRFEGSDASASRAFRLGEGSDWVAAVPELQKGR